MTLTLYFEDHFQLEATHPELVEVERWQDWFLTWLRLLAPTLPPGNDYELSLRLSDDQALQSLNAQYRQIDAPTDVLAFATLEESFPVQGDELGQEREPIYLGDIIISVNRALEQGQKYHHSLKLELAWLAAHGFLHLLGWDHPHREQLWEMLNQQEILLKTVGLAKVGMGEQSYQAYLDDYSPD